jgi:histidyl-tRNA synthetase
LAQRTEPARGMRDFLPDDVRRREYVIGIIKRVYERYGFEPLETPAVENIETLLGKYGEEGNQLIFKILKRGEHEATGQADLALRYDLTVPLARVVAQYQSKLPRLFKRYQIQPVWRADRRRAAVSASSINATSIHWGRPRQPSKRSCAPRCRMR